MAVGQFYYHVIVPPDKAGESFSIVNNLPNGQDELYDLDLVSGSGSHWKKVGIQAPPGTRVLVNNNSIVIGRSGVYELELDNANITSVVFPTQYKYQLKGANHTQAYANLNNALVSLRDGIAPYVTGELNAKSGDIENILSNISTILFGGTTSNIKVNSVSTGSNTYEGFNSIVNSFYNKYYGEYTSSQEKVELYNVIIDYIN